MFGQLRSEPEETDELPEVGITRLPDEFLHS